MPVSRQVGVTVVLLVSVGWGGALGVVGGGCQEAVRDLCLFSEAASRDRVS